MSNKYITKKIIDKEMSKINLQALPNILDLNVIH